ncbi:hypothetical protein BJ742DRAFT_844599 [Cladochytrium replicatum]|nr:hypothetical protein BJ742DRAFT_844599 [Cladochytrium replicatum]
MATRWKARSFAARCIYLIVLTLLFGAQAQIFDDGAPSVKAELKDKWYLTSTLAGTKGKDSALLAQMKQDLNTLLGRAPATSLDKEHSMEAQEDRSVLWDLLANKFLDGTGTSQTGLTGIHLAVMMDSLYNHELFSDQSAYKSSKLVQGVADSLSDEILNKPSFQALLKVFTNNVERSKILPGIDGAKSGSIAHFLHPKDREHWPRTMQSFWMRTAGNPHTSQLAPSAWNQAKKDAFNGKGTTAKVLFSDIDEKTVNIMLAQRDLGVDARVSFLNKMASLIDLPTAAGQADAFSSWRPAGFTPEAIKEGRTTIAKALRLTANEYQAKIVDVNTQLKNFNNARKTKPDQKILFNPPSGQKSVKQKFTDNLAKLAGEQQSGYSQEIRNRLLTKVRRAEKYRQLASKDLSQADVAELRAKTRDAKTILAKPDATVAEYQDSLSKLQDYDNKLEVLLGSNQRTAPELEVFQLALDLVNSVASEETKLPDDFSFDDDVEIDRLFIALHDAKKSLMDTSLWDEKVAQINQKIDDLIDNFGITGVAHETATEEKWQRWGGMADNGKCGGLRNRLHLFIRAGSQSCTKRRQRSFKPSGRPDLSKNEVEMLSYLKDNIDSSLLPDWDGKIESLTQEGELVGSKLVGGADSLNSARKIITTRLIQRYDAGDPKITSDVINKVLSSWSDEIEDTITELDLSDPQVRPSEKIFRLESVAANYNALAEASGLRDSIPLPDLRPLDEIAATHELKFLSLAKSFLKSAKVLPAGVQGVSESSVRGAVDPSSLFAGATAYDEALTSVAHVIVSELKKVPPPSRQRMRVLKVALSNLRASLDARSDDLEFKKQAGMTIELQDQRAFDSVFQVYTAVADTAADVREADMPNVPSDDAFHEIVSLDVEGVDFLDPTTSPSVEYAEPSTRGPVKGALGNKPTFAKVPSDAQYIALARGDTMYRSVAVDMTGEALELAVDRVADLADSYVRDPSSSGERGARAMDHIRAAYFSLSKVFTRYNSKLTQHASNANSGGNEASRSALKWARLRAKWRSLQKAVGRLRDSERNIRTSAQCSGSCSDNPDLTPVGDPSSSVTSSFDRSVESSALVDLKTAMDEVASSPDEVGAEGSQEAADLRDALLPGVDENGNVPADPRDGADGSENFPSALLRDAETLDNVHQTISQRLMRMLRRPKLKLKLSNSPSFARYFSKTFTTASGRVAAQAQLPIELRQRDPIVNAEIVRDSLSEVSREMSVGRTVFEGSTSGATVPVLDTASAITPEQLSSIAIDVAISTAEVTGETGPDRDILPHGIEGVKPKDDGSGEIDPSTIYSGASTTEEVYTGLGTKLKAFINNKARFLTKSQMQKMRVLLAQLKTDIDARASEIARKQSTNEEISRSEISGYSNRYETYNSFAKDLKDIDSSKLIGKEPPFNPNDPGIVAALEPKVVTPPKTGVPSRISGAIKAVKSFLKRKTLRGKLTKNGAGTVGRGKR